MRRHSISERRVRVVLVVAAALIDADGRVLLAQRPKGKPLEGLWEFPGGKIDAGELPEEALIRELSEELGIVVKAACLAPLTFASHAYDDFHLLMPLYVCRRWEGFVQPLDGQALKWVRPKDLAPLPDAAGRRAADPASRGPAGVRRDYPAGSGSRCPALVVLVRHFRQIADEGHHRPDVLIGRPGQVEARHAGELDAVPDHPEELRRGALFRHHLEIGGHRLQPFGPFGPIGVRRSAMTIDAADGRIDLRAGLDGLGIVEIGGRRVGCVARDRGAADARQRPVDDRGIVDVLSRR